MTKKEKVNLEKAIGKALKESGEIAGEGFIIRLAAITADAVEKFYETPSESPEKQQTFILMLEELAFSHHYHEPVIVKTTRKFTHERVVGRVKNFKAGHFVEIDDGTVSTNVPWNQIISIKPLDKS